MDPTTYKHGDLGDGLWHCSTRITHISSIVFHTYPYSIVPPWYAGFRKSQYIYIYIYYIYTLYIYILYIYIYYIYILYIYIYIPILSPLKLLVTKHLILAAPPARPWRTRLPPSYQRPQRHRWLEV